MPPRLSKLFIVCINPNVSNIDLIKSFFLSQNAILREVPTRDSLVVQFCSTFQSFTSNILTLSNTATLLNSSLITALLRTTPSSSPHLSSLLELIRSRQSIYSLSLLHHKVLLSGTLPQDDHRNLTKLLPYFGCSIVNDSPTLVVAKYVTSLDSLFNCPIVSSFLLSYVQNEPPFSFFPEDIPRDVILLPFSNFVICVKYLGNSESKKRIDSIVTLNGGQVVEVADATATHVIFDPQLPINKSIFDEVSLLNIPVMSVNWIFNRIKLPIPNDDDYILNLNSLVAEINQNDCEYDCPDSHKSPDSLKLFNGLNFLLHGFSENLNLKDQLSELISQNGGHLVNQNPLADVTVCWHGHQVPKGLRFNCLIVSPEWITISLWLNEKIDVNSFAILKPLNLKLSHLGSLYSNNELFSYVISLRGQLYQQCLEASCEILKITLADRLSSLNLTRLKFVIFDYDSSVSPIISDKIKRKLKVCLSKNLKFLSSQFISDSLNGNYCQLDNYFIAPESISRTLSNEGTSNDSSLLATILQQNQSNVQPNDFYDLDSQIQPPVCPRVGYKY
ncbi:hypothetical protein P9112_011501 [Eukaryota sp. TZLM1-RC]